MKVKHAINFHKGTTALFVFGLMVAYQNFTMGAWVYLALHGTYGFLWLLKDRIFPDKKWEMETSLGLTILVWFILLPYWVAPWLLVSQRIEPSPPLIGVAIALNLVGTVLHYTTDAQKYYTLKYHPGLIEEGFFARCRNTNYLGEAMIYSSFALLVQHWLPFVILGAFFLGIFVPNMFKKDQSLSRYPEFESYKTRSGLFFPKLWPVSTPVSREAGKV